MPRSSAKPDHTRAHLLFKTLSDQYPIPRSFLTHSNPFELLIATMLSAQCTDERVNKVTPALFEAFPDVASMAGATPEAICDTIRSVNFCYTKAIHIQKTASLLLSQHKGRVPHTLEELIALPGVGRKTAHVVLGQAFDIAGITVDTHVKRVSFRLGFTHHTDPYKIELDLQQQWPKKYWIHLSTLLIVHGRNQCTARRVSCTTCLCNSFCQKQGLVP